MGVVGVYLFVIGFFGVVCDWWEEFEIDVYWLICFCFCVVGDMV